MITHCYALLLRLYPRQFRAEFGEEMQAIFTKTILHNTGRRATLAVFLRELRDLPLALWQAHLDNRLTGGNMSTQNDFVFPSTQRQALIGTLPFLAFGIVVLIGNHFQLRIPQGVYLDFSFYLLALIGLLIGWVRGFPLWSYSYLGWSLVFAWSWTDMHTGGFELFGYVFTRQEAWGYRIWIPLGITILIALLWTRSLNPIKKFFKDIWNDWSRLVLTSFALISWVALMNYDENHHPWLLLLMLGSALTTSAGACFFLRSGSLRGRALSVTGGFIAAAVLGILSWATWEGRAYYGWPEADTWYESWGVSVPLLLAWFLILFWPALIALIGRLINRSMGQK